MKHYVGKMWSIPSFLKISLVLPINLFQTQLQEIKQYLEKSLRQRLGNRNGNGDGHADHRVVAREVFKITHVLDSHFSLSGMHFSNCILQKNMRNFEN